MDATELAHKMLKWEQDKRSLNALADEIQAAVLELGKTVEVGYTRATYSKGRKSYNHHAAADGHKMVTEATVSLFTTVIPQTEKIDWRGICEHAGIEEIPFTQAKPKVTLKLLR